jgi:hypothetical protein
MTPKAPAAALLAPVPKVHLDSAHDHGMTTVLFGTKRVDLFWERGVRDGARVYLYESLDDDRPVGESLVRWQGRYTRYVAHEALTRGDRRLRPPSTDLEEPWPIYWEVSDLRQLSGDEEFRVSDLTTEDGHPLSPALVPHGPTPIRG